MTRWWLTIFFKLIEMNRWWLTISTTASVVLFTLGAHMELESQHYAQAVLYLIFAFVVPLQMESLRDKILGRKFLPTDDGKISVQSRNPPAAGHSDP